MSTALKSGDKAPDFCLPDAQDQRICLRDFRGKWLVLYFYPKDNTTGCTREAVDFSSYVKDFDRMGAAVIGVSPDSSASHLNFINKHKISLILLSDTEHEVLEKYGVWQKKSMYGRQYYGVVRTTFVIDPRGKIKQVWTKVKVTSHADEVKAFVGESCKREVQKP